MFIIWLCWLFKFWKDDGELEVRTATYGPVIDQSQHAKSVSHIIKQIMSTIAIELKTRKRFILVVWLILHWMITTYVRQPQNATSVAHAQPEFFLKIKRCYGMIVSFQPLSHSLQNEGEQSWECFVPQASGGPQTHITEIKICDSF